MVQHVQDYEEEWKIVQAFAGSESLPKETTNAFNAPIFSLNKNHNDFLNALVKKLISAEGTIQPWQLNRVLTAAIRIFPFSFTLTTYAEIFYSKNSVVASEEVSELAIRRSDLKTPAHRITLPEVIASIENVHAAAAQMVQYKGVHVWPVVRNILISNVEKNVLSMGKLITRPNPGATAILKKARSAFSNVIKYVPPEIDFIEDDKRFINGDLDVEFLFFARSLRYYKQRGIFWDDGQLEKLHQLMQKDYSCLKLEEYTTGTLDRQPREMPPKYFRTPWGGDMAKLKDNLKQTRDFWANRGLEETLKLITDSCKKLRFDANTTKTIRMGMPSTVRCIEAYANHFHEMLQKIRPKFVFMELFTSLDSVGLIVACKALGIPVIEVQHGLIGTHHGVSTHWMQTPEQGYNTLPDYHWVFDDFEKQNVERYLDRNQPPLQGISGGIPDIEIRGKDDTPCSGDIYEKFYERLNQNTFNVLISLQYDDTDFSSLLELALHVPHDGMLLVRLHPMQTSLARDISNLFDRYGFSNVDVENATAVPLYDLLTHCHHVVTRYSTTAREAVEFGLEVTLNDPIGQKLYEQFIEKGRFGFAATTEELIELLKMSYERRKNAAQLAEQKARFDDFYANYISSSYKAGVEKLRSDWQDRREHRDELARKVGQLPIFMQPVDFKKEINTVEPKLVEIGNFNYINRQSFTVSQEIKLDREVLAKIFCYCLSELKNGSAVDIVFSSPDVLEHSQDILGLFFASSRNKFNVHLGKFGFNFVGPPHPGTMYLDMNTLESFDENDFLQQNKGQLPPLTTSGDVQAQTNSWLEQYEDGEPTANIIFGGRMSSDEIRGVISTEEFAKLSERYRLVLAGPPALKEVKHLLNSTRHFVFEPGFNSIEAIIALCQRGAFNVLVAHSKSEGVYMLGEVKAFYASPEQWNATCSLDFDTPDFEYSDPQPFGRPDEFKTRLKKRIKRHFPILAKCTGSVRGACKRLVTIKNSQAPHDGLTYANNGGELFAFYDLAVCPVTFDIANFLVLADVARREFGCKHVHIIIVPAPGHGFRDLEVHSIEHSTHRILSILAPACRTLPSCSGVTVLTDRNSAAKFKPNAIFPYGYTIDRPTAFYSWQNTWQKVNDQKEIQNLRAPDNSIEQARGWLEEKNLLGKKLAVVTLREASYQATRNSRLSDWSQFCTYLADRGYTPLIIRDFHKTYLPLPDGLKDFPTCDIPNWDLAFRLAIYECAEVSFFVNNGPWVLALFDEKVKLMATKVITEDVIVTSTRFRIEMGDQVGKNYKFLKDKQHVVWENDDFPTLVESFESRFSVN